MRDYRRAAHTLYALHYHFVFITKYRKPVLRGDVGVEVRDLIREICRTHDLEILEAFRQFSRLSDSSPRTTLSPIPQRPMRE